MAVIRKANPAGMILLLALLASAAPGCKRQGASGAGEQPLEQVRIGYFANLTHAQAVLGVASGDFQKAVAPATLDTKLFNAGPSLVEAMLADQVDIGYVGPGPVVNITARSQDQALRVIAAAASNGVLIVARQGAGISQLKDLKGKRLATPQHGNTQDIAARHYLTAVLHQADDGNVVPVANAEQAGMMSRGQIDAAWSPEPWGSRLIAQAGAVPVAEEKDLWPGKEFNITLVVTTPRFLADHPDVVEKVLRVHHQWTLRLQRDPDAYVGQLDDALYSLTGGRLPPGVLVSAIRHVKFTDQPLPDTLKTLGEWTYDEGLMQDPLTLDGLIDTRILRRVIASSPAQPITTAPSKEGANAADRLDSR